MTTSQNNWRSYSLGVFVLFQLIYLPTANCIKLVALRLPESTGELDDDIQLHGQQFPERVQALADGIGTAFVRYGELTGQAQGWSLFAPIFGHQASLPMVLVNTATGGVVHRSQFAPRNPDSFHHFRFADSACRLFNYEYRLALICWNLDPENWDDESVIWRDAVRKRVRRQQKSISAYFQWLQQRKAWTSPTEMILCAQLIDSPPIGADSTNLLSRPLSSRDVRGIWIAAWKLQLSKDPSAIFAWDQKKREFVPLEAEP